MEEKKEGKEEEETEVDEGKKENESELAVNGKYIYEEIRKQAITETENTRKGKRIK